MFCFNRGFRTLCYLACVPLISGCAGVAPVKDIAADKMGYLSRNFSVKSLKTDVVKAFQGSKGPSVSYHELIVSYNVETVLQNDNKSISNATAKYIPLEGGAVQRLWEYTTNDIPNALIFNISYQGLLNLRWQQVLLQANSSGLMMELKKLTRLDPIPGRENETFTMEYEAGSEMPFDSPSPGRFVCKTTKIHAANTINEKLSGDAIDMDCDSFVNNAVSSRSKFVFLKEYGVALMLDLTTTSSKAVYKINAVTIN